MQCSGQPVLPVGLKDEIGVDTVKLFCPKCQCVYHLPVNRSRSLHLGSTGNTGIDGASFGTTFPHLFLMTFSQLVPDPLPEDSVYVPRVFGFRVHPSARQRTLPQLSMVPTSIAPRQQQQQQAQRPNGTPSDGYVEDVSKSETPAVAARTSLQQQQSADAENSGKTKTEDDSNISNQMKRTSEEVGNGISESSAKRRKRQDPT